MKLFARFHFFSFSSAVSILLGLSGCATLPSSQPDTGPRPEDTIVTRPADTILTAPVVSSHTVVRSTPIRPIWYQQPEPKNEGIPSPIVEPTPPPEPTKPQSDYVIQKGDTLCKIARRFHISLRELLEENHLDKNVTIHPGQKIILPGVPSEDLALFATDGEYKVRSGDTLCKIAKRHGITVSDLKSSNNLRNDRIIVGQTLTIPHKEGNSLSEKQSSHLEKHQSAPYSQPYNDANGIYTVQRGDSLFSIAKKTGTTFSELQALNDISNPRNLQIGQKLRIHQELPSSTTTFTTTTPIVAMDSDNPIPPENSLPHRSTHEKYRGYLNEDDFFEKNIDDIPVIQIREE
jgi:LysM repeat protein